MKLVKLLNLNINNFKGIKSADIDFSDITKISGRNELGKSSIVDSFYWLIDGVLIRPYWNWNADESPKYFQLK